MKCIERFRDDCLFRGLSELTIQRYIYIAKAFTEHVDKSENFNKQDVISYLAHLRKSGCKSNYLRLIFIVLRRFFRANDLAWEFEKSDIPKREEKFKAEFTREELDKILEVAKKKNVKTYAIIRLSRITGLRRIEIRNLDRKDFFMNSLTFKTAKGGKLVTKVLDDETVSAIQAYLSTRIDKHPALFLASRVKPRRYSLGGLSKLFRTVRRKALGFKKERAGYHAQRRAFVTLAHDSGLSESEITAYMGWRSHTTVHEYILLKPRKIREKVKRVHPLLQSEKS